jgi:hypothetical protein
LAIIQVILSIVLVNQPSASPHPLRTSASPTLIFAGLSGTTVLDASENVDPAEETANVYDAFFGFVQERLTGLPEYFTLL